MPHVSSSGGGDDLGSEDEVKVFKDEGEDEKRSSENLTEEKSSLIDLTESEVRSSNENLHTRDTDENPLFSPIAIVTGKVMEKGSLAGGSYATTGKTSARSDLSPVFGRNLAVPLFPTPLLLYSVTLQCVEGLNEGIFEIPGSLDYEADFMVRYTRGRGDSCENSSQSAFIYMQRVTEHACAHTASSRRNRPGLGELLVETG
ncbi:Protein pangolin, isoforms A/H/I [Eufriesea mexicana]|nr:Protein pangolin, isoforms A/H/I [Eufriesea mexicana]